MNNQCFDGIIKNKQNNIVITNDSLYRQLEDSLKIHPQNLYCDTAHLPPIDFSKYTLLACKSMGACSIGFINRLVLEDKKYKKYIYRINIKYEGQCKLLVITWNWVLVPKLPKDYCVSFELNEN